MVKTQEQVERKTRAPRGIARPMVVHLTTVPTSLSLLLATELRVAESLGLDVVGMSSAGDDLEEVLAAGVHHIVIPSLTRSWSFRSDLRAIRELYATFRRIRPAIVHTHTPKAGVYGRIAARMAGVPVIVNTCHGLWPADAEKNWKAKSVIIAAEAVASRFCDAELFQNSEDARTMRRFTRNSKVRVVGNGTDLTRYTFDPVARQRLRAEWGVDEDTCVVLGVGRVIAAKGVGEFCAAAALAEGGAAVTRWMWAGFDDGARTDFVPSWGRVSYLGNRRDMPDLYSAADVFVLPSYREGLPRSAMEAASVGLPLVLTDVRGTREIGVDGQECVYVPARDAAALHAAVDELVASPTTRASLARRGHDRAREMFDQVRVTEWSVATYRACAVAKGLSWAMDLPDLKPKEYVSPKG